MTLIRTALFYVIAALAVVVCTPIVLLLSPFPFRSRWAVAYGWSRFMLATLRIVCGVRYEVRGAEHLRGPRAAVAYWKHQSAWETIAMIAVCPQQTWVLKRELMWVPFLGWALSALKPIAIDRGSGRRAVMQVVEQGTRALADGRWVMIYPEGTRLPPMTTRRYGISGAVLATKAGAPLVPIAHDAGSLWPRKGLIRPGTVTVVVGAPLEPHGKTPDALNAEAHAWIDARMAELEGGPSRAL
jgi:1-acyl-sn-glycerol-3-phosphate acyltransferase